jgi:calcium/calmodulin-dependent protein kinase I
VAIKKTTPTVLDRRDAGGRIRTTTDVEAREQEVKTLLLLRGTTAATAPGVDPTTLPVLYLYEYFWDYNKTSGRGDIYLVTDLLGQQLDDWRNSCTVFTETIAIDVCRAILHGIEYMHDRGVVHRDLTMPNILFSSNGRTLKIIDFTLARVLGEGEVSRDFCGTGGYIAPEVYQGRPYRFEVDLFAFGVILYRLLSSNGEAPFPAAQKEESLRLQTVGLRYSLTDEHWDSVSPLAMDMISKLLTSERKRLTVKSALEHPWLLSTK